jgi:hypothetical protein
MKVVGNLPTLSFAIVAKNLFPFSFQKGMEWILEEFEKVGKDEYKLEEKYGKVGRHWLKIAQERKRREEEQQKKRQEKQEDVTLEKMRLLKFVIGGKN